MDTRIHDKLDKLDSRLDSVDKRLDVYNEQLSEHMRRTEIVEQELKPVRDHVLQMRGAGKLITILALVATILAAIIKI